MNSYSVSGSRLYVWPAILAVIAVAGILLLLSGAFSLPPSDHIPLEQTGLELLAPLSPIVSWAAWIVARGGVIVAGGWSVCYLLLRRRGGVFGGKLIAAVKGGKKPITLDLTSPTPVQSPLPEGEGRDPVKEVDSEEAQPEEARGYEDRSLEQALPIYIGKTIVGEDFIVDRNGAEKLYGKGDGLFFSPSSEYPVRFQGAYAEGGGE